MSKVSEEIVEAQDLFKKFQEADTETKPIIMRTEFNELSLLAQEEFLKLFDESQKEFAKKLGI